MKIKTAILILACAGSAFGANVVVVVRPRFVAPRYNSASFAGGLIGSAIGQWIANRQARAAGVGGCFDSMGCDPSDQAVTAPPYVAPVVLTGPGTSYLPGQCPGIAPCATTAR